MVSQNHIVILLRQVGSLLPGDTEPIPNEIAGLSFAQIYLLASVFKLEKTGRMPLTLSVLSQETGFSKPTICTTLKKLRRTGFVRMQIDDADNRRKKIMLTQRAWKVESSIIRYISALDRTLCIGISPQNLCIMEQSLRMLLKNIKKQRTEQWNTVTEDSVKTKEVT